jgi:hypothetical protein
MPNSPGGDTAIAPPGGLVPQIALLHRHYVALGHSRVGISQRSAVVVHEAIDARARARRVRDEVARGRAARKLEHRRDHPAAQAEGIVALLAEVISGTPAREPDS